MEFTSSLQKQDEPKKEEEKVKETQKAEIDSSSEKKSLYFRELKDLLYYTIPISISYFFLYLPLPATTAFATQLNPNEERAIIITHEVFSLIVISFAYGIINTSNCLFAQAVGRGDQKALKTIFQRNVFVSFGLFLLIASPLMIVSQGIAAHIDELEIWPFSNLFTIILIPGSLGLVLYANIMQFYQSQYKLALNIISTVTANAVMFVVYYVFVIIFNHGIWSIAIGLSLCYILMPIIAIIAGIIEGTIGESNILVFDKECLKDLGDYFRMSVSSMILITITSIPFYTASVLAKGLSLVAEQTQSLMIRVMDFFHLVPEGLSSTATTQIASHIGKRDSKACRAATHVSLVLHFLLALIISAGIIVFHSYLFQLLSKKEEVLLESKLIYQYLLIPGVLFVCYNGGLAVLNSASIFTIPAIITSITVFCEMIPLAMTLTYRTSLDLSGYWIALTIWTFTLCLYSIIYALSFRWDAICSLVSTESLDLDILNWCPPNVLKMLGLLNGASEIQPSATALSQEKQSSQSEKQNLVPPKEISNHHLRKIMYFLIAAAVTNVCAIIFRNVIFLVFN